MIRFLRLWPGPTRPLGKLTDEGLSPGVVRAIFRLRDHHQRESARRRASMRFNDEDVIA